MGLTHTHEHTHTHTETWHSHKASLRVIHTWAPSVTHKRILTTQNYTTNKHTTRAVSYRHPHSSTQRHTHTFTHTALTLGLQERHPHFAPPYKLTTWSPEHTQTKQTHTNTHGLFLTGIHVGPHTNTHTHSDDTHT